jgi:two-component system phosphate regulon sensor histidine kinase PhoR
MKDRLSFRFTFDRMRKNFFLLIVFINSAALIGIFVTQVYWIREAYGLLDEQFTNTVRIALKGVANQMLNYELKHSVSYAFTDQDSTSSELPDVRNLSLNLLEFKINEEFSCMHVGKDYEFAIIDLKDKSIVMGKSERYSHELHESRHQISLVGFKDSDHYVLSAYFPEQQNLIMRKLVNWIIISIIFAIILIIGFPVSLYIFNRQKKVSGMKTDFINNMTHEFRTPIATISLASEMLMKKTIQEDPAKTQRYARIIFDENTRLQNHVEQILSVTMLERGQFHLKKKEIDVHELINEVVENFGLTVVERDGKIRTHYCANNFMIKGDRDHLKNVITNLLDNANKYSPEKPWIRIGTQNTEHGLIITVEDRGIGISLENQRQVFKNLYRVPTGNIYNVKGFGIGLYYVKTIVEAHGGHIILKSELNKGSRFDVYLPFDTKSSKDDAYNQTENSAC